METVLIRIVGDDYMEFTQGRPFGFEVECVTADGDPTQGQLFSAQLSHSRLLKVTQGYSTLKGLN